MTDPPRWVAERGRPVHARAAELLTVEAQERHEVCLCKMIGAPEHPKILYSEKSSMRD